MCHGDHLEPMYAIGPSPKKIMNMNMIMNMIMHHVQSKIKDISYMIYTLNYVL